jgi:hypothetical protein
MVLPQRFWEVLLPLLPGWVIQTRDMKQKAAHVLAAIGDGASLILGPTGTGKTTAAWLIASIAGVPLIYVHCPKVAIVLKQNEDWFGEIVGKFNELVKRGNAEVILFFDEIDAIAGRNTIGMWRVVALMEEIKIVGVTNTPDQIDPRVHDRVYPRYISIDYPSAVGKIELLMGLAKQEALSFEPGLNKRLTLAVKAGSVKPLMAVWPRLGEVLKNTSHSFRRLHYVLNSARVNGTIAQDRLAEALLNHQLKPEESKEWYQHNGIYLSYADEYERSTARFRGVRSEKEG